MAFAQVVGGNEERRALERTRLTSVWKNVEGGDGGVRRDVKCLGAARCCDGRIVREAGHDSFGAVHVVEVVDRVVAREKEHRRLTRRQKAGGQWLVRNVRATPMGNTRHLRD